MSKKTYEVIAVLHGVDDPRKLYIEYDPAGRVARFPVHSDMSIIPKCFPVTRRDVIGPSRDRIELTAKLLSHHPPLKGKGYSFEVAEASGLSDRDRRHLIALKRERDSAAKSAGVLASCVSYTPPRVSGPVEVPAKVSVRFPGLMTPSECLTLGLLIVATSRLAVTEQLFFVERERSA